ncbi:bifunctional diguanylate cyclase/phosphodiesterase [Anaerosacchariphilus polymeriproducens]|uniref:EAL domain-containing protein n=1 Tax=Anaerosacchariphilus polymeriproducens TaxID=1812858 RepID=A0A371ATE4_9FIRM|nr:EAL domain-containing protein [Anaerosacchariphilus polymeriproducens]RDU22740.1 EAL domain-containing protein [Anaerosacchariphilus polymeriproducens]
MIRKSIRNKFILAIFMGCLIPYLLGGLYLKSFIEKKMYQTSIEHSKQILQKVSELIDNSLIHDMKQEVTLLASLDVVKNAGKNLNNYSKYDETYIYEETKTEKTIKEYFKVLKESHESTNFIFLGMESGGYMEYPRFIPTKSYDPRTRPWYKQAINKDKIIMSDPYITSNTNEMVVSFAKKIQNKAETVGVVGISVKLDELNQKISNTKIGKSGFVFVMSPNRKFIVSPNNPEWILKTPEELGIEGFKNSNLEKGVSFTTKLNNVEYVFNAVVSKESGLYVISAADKEEILNETRKIPNILITIYAITYVIVFVIIYQISRRITKPILEISSVINHMTDFDFNFADNKEILHYTKRMDEIGIVSKALVNLHDNFNELMKQVNMIDDEIRNINIEESKKYQLEVSEDNPFNGVICSMNALLDKVDLYFETLKSKNKEIIKNNELLTATEEELRAQLDQINEQKEHINFLAYHDALTGLPNRRKFVENLTNKIASKQEGAVILLDIDDFKGINDTLGHVFGDKVIDTVAKRLQDIAVPQMFISRFGGDEFLILIEHRKEIEELNEYLNKICSIFDEKIHIDGNDIEIRISMGITLFPQNSKDVDQLVMQADLAMYSVKNSGKNGYKYFNYSMMEHQITKSNIEFVLRDAIENDGFKIVYQPQINVRNGEIAGYEALLRLRDFDFSPAEFIDIAEKNGMIIKIGRIVTEKVIEQLNQWKEKGLEIKPVAINFSANQLHDYGYISFVESLLEKYHLDARYIEIEITENIFLENKQVTLAFLKNLKQMGIKIAIDDFGTGYSSLNYLTFLPVDIVKLDRSLNLKFLEMNNVKVMNSLISLVHSLGLVVIAEGIETLEQVKKLDEAYCDYIQGYYFSKPIEANQIIAINSKIYDLY